MHSVLPAVQVLADDRTGHGVQKLQDYPRHLGQSLEQTGQFQLSVQQAGIRRRYLPDTGIFYAQGVRANVLFFDARPASKSVQTKEVWVYDYRTNVHHTLKTNPMQESDLAEFVKCYNPENRHQRKETWSEDNPDGRWRRFSYDEIVKREGTNLDFKWIKEKTDSVEDVSIGELMDELKSQREAYDTAVDGLAAALAEVGE